MGISIKLLRRSRILAKVSILTIRVLVTKTNFTHQLLAFLDLSSLYNSHCSLLICLSPFDVSYVSYGFCPNMLPAG